METHTTQHEVRLVLLGKTGAGKSASGNTILSAECFDAEVSMGSVTKECKSERGTVQGRNLLLVDTPGLFDTDLTIEQLQHEIIHGLTLCSPGPHAFLLVIPVERYTQEQQRTVEMIRHMLQHDITDHTIIIFSHADRLPGTSIEEFISRQNPKVQELVEMFGKRYVAFDNTHPENRDQVTRLMERVDELLLQNDNKPFSNQVTEVIQKAHAIIDERRSKIKEEVQKEADDRWAAFTVDMNEDRKDSEKIKKRAKDRIERIETDIINEEQNVKPIPERLERLRASLKMEQKYIRRLEEEEARERKEREENEKMNMDVWIKEEQQRRESQPLHDTKMSNYNLIVTGLSSVLLGVGISSFAPALLAFLFPAVPAVVEAGLAAQILAQMINLVGEGGAAILLAGLKTAALTRCTIQ